MQRVVMYDISLGRLIRIRFAEITSNRQEVVEKTSRKCFADPARTENFRNLSKFGANRQKNSQKKQAGRQTNMKVCQKRAPRPPLAPPKTLQEFLGGYSSLFSSWGFGTLELPERAPRLGKTRISAVSAMSGMAWPNRGLKDMTSMSGLRQGFPQENGLRPVVQHAWRVRRAADCLRFASPAEATWRLEALRL